jgi:hypothetical protein
VISAGLSVAAQAEPAERIENAVTNKKALNKVSFINIVHGFMIINRIAMSVGHQAACILLKSAF